MTRSYKAVSISFLVLALLVGCDGSAPSNSDIKKQLLSQVSPCPELSISDFQKLNGYPQNDGSYIDQIQYNLVFTPSDDMLNYVSDYDNKLKSIESEGASDYAKATAINVQTKSMSASCSAAYTSNLPAINAELANAYKTLLIATNDDTYYSESQGPTLSGDPSTDTGQIDNAIFIAQNNIKAEQSLEQEQLEADRATAEANLRDEIAQGVLPFGSNTQVPPGTVSPGDAQVIASTNKNIAAYTSYINTANTIKAKFTDILNQYSSCQGKVQALYQANQGTYDHLKALNAEQISAQDEDLRQLQAQLNTDCPIIVLGGVLGMFNANKDDIDSYGKTYKVAEGGNVRFIKSDNGWVIQN